MIEIDGSLGAAGGQMLRTALSLSCLLNKPFRIFNIRKSRKKPGLMAQHLMCVRALERISGADVKGAEKGSLDLIFEPDKIRPGKYVFDIGTAGSTSLLLQALLPPLVFAEDESSLTLIGGTHVPFSPIFHYIDEVFIPMLAKLRIVLRGEIEHYGFYPKGGGKIKVRITPAKGINGVDLSERGKTELIGGTSGVGNLPLSIAGRQKESALKILAGLDLITEMETVSVPAIGRGTFMFLKVITDYCVAGFSSLGERGKKAEIVGEEAANALLSYYPTSACLDRYLADQITLYLAVAGSDSVFTTSHVSDHLLTNLAVMKKFLNINYTVEGEMGMPGKIIMRST